MSRIFICDNCGKRYSEPLDQQEYKDEHGISHMIDLDAPCRDLLKIDSAVPIKTFLDKAVTNQTAVNEAELKPIK